MTLTPPFVLVDRYEITAEIGRGGHAIVYHAHDRVLDRDVAVKLLREEVVSSDTLARFRQEVQVTAQLEHAHILHVYDTGAYEGRPYIVMELASGRTLAERVEREGQLPVLDAVQIARDVGLALAHAHARGIVHRDVKPENILLSANGAILADFGIARITAEDLMRRITSTGTAVGTVQYMSPEQLCAEPNIDGRSDQYSLACVLYEMLAGVRPHTAATFEGLRLLRMTGQCVPVSAHRPSVSAMVDDAIAVALSPMAADRFRTMDEFLVAIGVGASGEFAVSDRASGARRSGGYGVVAASGGRGAGGASAPPLAAVVPPPRARLSKFAKPIAAIGVVAIGALAVFKAGRSGESGGTLDDGAVAVALVDDAGANADTTSVDGRVRRALRSELEAWSGLRVVRALPSRDSSALAIASSVGTVGDSVQIRLEVRRSAGGAAQRVDVLVPANDGSAPARVVAGLVKQALVRAMAPALTMTETPGLEAMPVRSMTVLRAYVSGFVALRAGQLDSAVGRFREAARASKAPYAQAEFWAAQSGAWAQPARSELWKPDVDRALRASTLHGVDSLLAAALHDLSEADFPSACRDYSSALTTDPANFVALYGLGTCQLLDAVVVRSTAGLHWRSSHWGALAAYRKSLTRVPTAEWLAALFPPMLTSTYAIAGNARTGYAVADSGTQYYALPSQLGDTIGFEPLTPLEFSGQSKAAVPRTLSAALRTGRAEARRLTEAWTRVFPMSADGWYWNAITLELDGAIAIGESPLLASGSLRRAKGLSPSAELATDIAVSEVRLALRRGDFAIAGRIARSAAVVDSAHAERFSTATVPLAALVGAEIGDNLGRWKDEARRTGISSAVSDSIRAFRWTFMLGECAGLSERLSRLDRMLREGVAPVERDAQSERWLAPVIFEAVPCLGVSAARGLRPSRPLHSAYAALARGDSAGARQVLAVTRANRAGATASTTSWDATFAEAWTLVQVGDSAEARRLIVAALADIGNTSLRTLTRVEEASGLRQACLLLLKLEGAATKPLPPIEQLWSTRARQLVDQNPL